MMARTLGLSLEEMSTRGLKWKNNVVISSMCTVFAESEVVSLVAQNKDVADIIHGLNVSVASKVGALAARLGQNNPGEYMMTGGVAQNQGIVEALEEKLGAKLYICDEAQLSSLLEVTHEDAAEYIAQARRTSHTRLMRMLDLFLASETDMKWAAQPRFALETAALRACAPEESLQVEALVARVDELERKLREGVVTAAPTPKSAKAAPIDAPAAQTEAPEIAKEAPQGPAADAERIWQDAMRQAKQKPQLFGMLKFGRLVSGDNGLFTVVYPRATGGAYVKMLSMAEKNAEVADYLTKAAGYPCTFRAAIEGTVQESDKAILAAQEEAQKQAENSLNKVFDMFGRENVRVKDE